jgi:hypothetical protein
MDRSIFGLFGHTLLGFSAIGLAAMGFVWSSTPASGEPPKGEGEWRLLEPITYENLTVFPVVSSTGYDTSEFLTLEDGISRGEVIAREQGAETLVRNRNSQGQAVPNYSGPSVNQLVLVNNSKRPLLLLAGELVSGGKQDRIIAKDRIVAPGADPLPLDVFCVEHGRWSQGAQFSAAKTIVHPSVREQAVNQSQTDVWASVRSGTVGRAPVRSPSTSGAGSVSGTASANQSVTVQAAPRVNMAQIESAMQTEAPTQSYAKIYGSRQIGGSADALVAAIEARFRKETSGLKGEHVVGVVIAYGGEVAWSDIFASGDLFDQYWNKLLQSYAVEAVARPTLRERATAEDASEFLRHLKGREQTESDPGVYLWRETKGGTLSQIELEVFLPKTMTVHRLVLRRTS